MNRLKLFLTRIIWGRKLTVVEAEVLSSIDSKKDNIIVISKGEKFVLDGHGNTFASITFISGELTREDFQWQVTQC